MSNYSFNNVYSKSELVGISIYELKEHKGTIWLDGTIRFQSSTILSVQDMAQINHRMQVESLKRKELKSK